MEDEKRNEESWLRLSMWVEFEKMKGVENRRLRSFYSKVAGLLGTCAKPPMRKVFLRHNKETAASGDGVSLVTIFRPFYTSRFKW